MSDEYLVNRRKALEESFFARRDQELLENLQRELETEDRKRQLASASGIQQDDVLQALVDMNISGETLAALSLVPLIAVAWADGTVEARERDAVLQAAHDSGLGSTDPSSQLLMTWLQQPPPPELISTWKEYVGALTHSVSERTRQALRQDLMGRARRVAQAAGGILGIAAISSEEQKMLAELDRAFEQ